MSELEPGSVGVAEDDDRTPVARLRRAELQVARLEGQVETLRRQVAAQEAADEHRRVELAAVRAEIAEAQASARDAHARAEERQHLIDELRRQLAVDKTEATRAHAGNDGAKILRWPSRGRGNKE